MKRSFAASLVCLPLLLGAVPVLAQDFHRFTNMFGDDRGNEEPGYDRGGAPDRGGGGGYDRGGQSDAAGLEVRLGKLEGRIRTMTGQIEELQNANRKLVEQVQRFQQDVDSRLSSGGARSHRSEASSSPPEKAPPPAPAAESDGATPKHRGHGDAYDPDSAPGNNPGRPKPLGSAASVEESGAAPMDLSGGRLRRNDGASGSDTSEPTLRLPKTASATPGDTAAGTLSPTSPRAAFDQALTLYKGKQYEEAEKGFASFIQKNPKSRLAADATYYLGESFQQRGRSREAAEQYLKVSKEYAASSRAPDAMLHLGISLKALGAKEQACATFGEVNRKYPNAPAYVKSGVERESKRAQCG